MHEPPRSFQPQISALKNARRHFPGRPPGSALHGVGHRVPAHSQTPPALSTDADASVQMPQMRMPQMRMPGAWQGHARFELALSLSPFLAISLSFYDDSFT